MDWRAKLRKASFRGVEFYVDSTSSPVGRKVQLHEYPKRDIPFAEDMGKVSRTYRFRAFVIGNDCFDQRDKLLKALETEGAGTLVHPWLGTLTVKPGQCTVSHERLEGGMVRFDLVFFPGEEISAPGATANTAQLIRSSGLGFIDSARQRFTDAIGDINFAGVNVRQLGNALAETYEAVADEVSGFSDLVGDVASFVNIAVTAPSALPGMILDVIADEFGFTGAVDSVFKSFTSSVSSINSITRSLKRTDAGGGVSDAGGDDTKKLTQAVNGLVQDSLILKAGGEAAVAELGTKPQPPAKTPSLDQQAVTPITRPEVPVADDVIDAREDLNDEMWKVSENSPEDHFIVLNDFRQTVYKHLSEVAQSGVNLIDKDLNEITPALAIAWTQWQDGTRDAEVVQRNKIIHPGFVHAGKISVAQE